MNQPFNFVTHINFLKNEFDLNWLVDAVEEVLSVKEESEIGECGSDGEQDPSVWKRC